MNIKLIFDLVNRIQNKETGCWYTKDPAGKHPPRELVLAEGRVVSAMSYVEGETLSDVLQEMNVLTAQDVEDIFSKRRRYADLVREEDAARAVERIAIKVIEGGLLGYERRAFEPEFKADKVPMAGRFVLNTKSIFIGGVVGASRSNMALSMLGAFGGEEQVIQVRPTDLSGISVPNDLQTFLPLLDGTHTLREIAQKAGGRKERMGGLMYALREMELATIRPLEVAPFQEVAEPVAEVRVAHEEIRVEAPIEAVEIRVPEVARAEEEMGLVVQAAPLTPEARMELVTQRYKSPRDVAQAFGVSEDEGTSPVLVGEIHESRGVREVRFADPERLLENMDPRMAAFVEILRPKPFPWVKLLAAMGVMLAVFAGGIIWFVSARIPNLRGGVRPKLTPVGEVHVDPLSRVKALQDLDLQVALAQGNAYLLQLQREDQDQWTIRLGIAVQSRQVHGLLGVLGDWKKADVFVVPIELEGNKDCYQVFYGTFKDEAAAREAMKAFEERARAAKMTVAPFNVLRVPRAA